VPIITKQELNRYFISDQDFEKAIAFLKEAETQRHDTLAYEAFLTCAVIYYYRPFSKNEKSDKAEATRRLSIDDFADLTEADKEVHQRCKDIRNTAIAHAEYSHYPTKLHEDTKVFFSSRYDILREESIFWKNLCSLAQKLKYQCTNLRADYANRDMIFRPETNQ